ncbi:hypothetical protein HOD88_00210 [archaeon]|jgi:hypothetical protein|nr:hypothetical protein [archaeon]
MDLRNYFGNLTNYAVERLQETYETMIESFNLKYALAGINGVNVNSGLEGEVKSNGVFHFARRHGKGNKSKGETTGTISVRNRKTGKVMNIPDTEKIPKKYQRNHVDKYANKKNKPKY